MILALALHVLVGSLHGSHAASVSITTGRRLPPVSSDPTAAHWITGALIPVAAETTVCSTSNGCTSGAFLACSDISQKITNITFASYVSFCCSPYLRVYYMRVTIVRAVSISMAHSDLNLYSNNSGQPK